MGEATDRLVVMLARVRVKPYQRRIRGKLQSVVGYDYSRQGGKAKQPVARIGKHAVIPDAKKAAKAAREEATVKRIRQMAKAFPAVRADARGLTDKKRKAVVAKIKARAGLPEGVSKGAGTKEDPYITTDVEAAARLLGEDKYVQLKRPREVSTLLDKLGQMVEDAKKRGESAPVYDLCKVTVKGTNLFCVESKGIPRVQMPQLAGPPEKGTPADDESKFPKNEVGWVDLGPAFVEHLEGKGIDVSEGSVGAEFLKASQSELNGGKVAQIVRVMERGETRPGMDDPLFVSEDDYIIDGHHRWAASVGFGIREGKQVKIKTRRVKMDIISILREAHDWTYKMGIGGQEVG